MARRDVDAAIANVAENQWSAFSLAQLEAVGGNRSLAIRRCRSGTLRRAGNNVFVFSGTRSTWSQRMWIALLEAGPLAFVAHRASAALQRMAGFKLGIVEIGVPANVRVRTSARVHLTSNLIPADLTTIRGFPCLSATRTLLAVAWYVDVSTFEIVAEDAFHKGLTSLSRLAWRYHELKANGRPGIATVGQFLKMRAAATGKSRSELETRFDQVARLAGMPDAQRNVIVQLPNGKHAEIDRYWPLFDLAVEIDGDETHGSRIARIDEKRRQNQLYLLKKAPLRFSYWDLYDTVDDTLAILRAAMHLKAA